MTFLSDNNEFRVVKFCETSQLNKKRNYRFSQNVGRKIQSKYLNTRRGLVCECLEFNVYYKSDQCHSVGDIFYIKIHWLNTLYSLYLRLSFRCFGDTIHSAVQYSHSQFVLSTTRSSKEFR